MTKSDLIGRLAQHHPQLVQKDAEYSMRIILDAMAAALGQGDRIEIRAWWSIFVAQQHPCTLGGAIPLSKKCLGYAETRPVTLYKGA